MAREKDLEEQFHDLENLASDGQIRGIDKVYSGIVGASGGERNMCCYWYISVEIYLSPVSGTITTIVFFRLSGRFES